MNKTVHSGGYATIVVNKSGDETRRLMQEAGLLERIRQQGIDCYIRGDGGLSDMTAAEHLHVLLTGKQLVIKPGRVLCLFLRRSHLKNGVEEKPIETFAGELGKLCGVPEEVEEVAR